jgi:hypothetical protein
MGRMCSSPSEPACSTSIRAGGTCPDPALGLGKTHRQLGRYGRDQQYPPSRGDLTCKIHLADEGGCRPWPSYSHLASGATPHRWSRSWTGSASPGRWADSRTRPTKSAAIRQPARAETAATCKDATQAHDPRAGGPAAKHRYRGNAGGRPTDSTASATGDATQSTGPSTDSRTPAPSPPVTTRGPTSTTPSPPRATPTLTPGAQPPLYRRTWPPPHHSTVQPLPHQPHDGGKQVTVDLFLPQPTLETRLRPSESSTGPALRPCGGTASVGADSSSSREPAEALEPALRVSPL